MRASVRQEAKDLREGILREVEEMMNSEEGRRASNRGEAPLVS